MLKLYQMYKFKSNVGILYLPARPVSLRVFDNYFSPSAQCITPLANPRLPLSPLALFSFQNMRKLLFFSFLTYAFSGCGTQASQSTTPTKGLQGKWNNITVYNGRNSEFLAYFRSDGTYDGILDGKVLVSGGSYKEVGDTVSFSDAICNAAYTGTYKVKYEGDSVHFQLISDTSTVRREGTDGVGMKRVEK